MKGVRHPVQNASRKINSVSICSIGSGLNVFFCLYFLSKALEAGFPVFLKYDAEVIFFKLHNSLAKLLGESCFQITAQFFWRLWK